MFNTVRRIRRAQRLAEVKQSNGWIVGGVALGSVALFFGAPLIFIPAYLQKGLNRVWLSQPESEQAPGPREGMAAVRARPRRDAPDPAGVAVKEANGDLTIRPEDLGKPISHMNQLIGLPVFCSDREHVGEVARNLVDLFPIADPHEPIFNGIVFRVSPLNMRLVEPDQIERIHERGVVLRIDRAAAEALPQYGGWLVFGSSDGRPVRTKKKVLATGLHARDQVLLVRLALDAGSARRAVLGCEGPRIGPLLDREVLHYDMTGTCRGDHPHVVWDPAIDPATLSFAVMPLIEAVSDPDWKPEETVPATETEQKGRTGPGIVGLANYLRPEIPVLGPLLIAVLNAAGQAGGGVRQAMDLLSSDQLEQAVAAVRSTYSNPFISEQLETLFQGPPQVRQWAIHAAWRALAPLEEVNRKASARHMVQPLDIGTWLRSSTVLAISLPPAASVGHQQIVKAILTVEEEKAKEQEIVPTPSRSGEIRHYVWLDMPCPRMWAWPLDDPSAVAGVAFEEATASVFVVATQSERFAQWAGSEGSPDLLIGADAAPSALDAASRVVGRRLDAPATGSVILIRDGTAETLVAPLAGQR
jgi:hypothetical protein